MSTKMTKAELAQALEAANKKNETALVSFTTRIPTKLQSQIKAEAFSRGISVQTLVTAIFEQHFTKSDQEQRTQAAKDAQEPLV